MSCVRVCRRVAGGLVVAAAFSAGLVVEAADAPLRYGWKAGEKYGYEVKITADKGDEIETLSGTPVFVVKSANDDQAELVVSKPGLASSTKAKAGRRRGLRGFRRPRPPRIPRIGRPGTVVGHHLTLDPYGRVVTEKGDSQLPYVLGNLAQVIFEPLAEEEQSQWTRTRETAIRITSDWPPFSPFRRDVEKERLNAEETYGYSVEDVTDATATLRKTYRLATVEKVDGEPRMEMTGEGTIAFDRERGLPTKIEYDAVFHVRSENVVRKFPIEVRARLLTPEELKQVQVAPSAGGAARAELSAEKQAAFLADLKSGEVNRARRAVIFLQNAKPAEANEEMSAALVEWLKHDDRSVRFLAAKSLESWATEDSAPALLEALQDDFPLVVASSMKALGRLGDERAAPKLVAGLAELQHRLAAAAGLRAMGAKAEVELHSALEHEKWDVRLEACRILADVGTKKSLAKLREVAAGDENALVRRTAQQAIEAIDKRIDATV